MGLCKCRTVTPLFCFEHRKNVCEKCVLADHPTCVVRTYLQWLQDSEFDPNCSLCQKPFTDGRPILRLSCFDLFHWECLERILEGGGRLDESGDDPFLSVATTTTPTPSLARAKCPLCKAPIIPAINNSPLLEQMRGLLASTKWGSQLPPPPPSLPPSAIDKLGLVQEEPQLSLVNGAQPNEEKSSSSMITIEMGVRPSFAPPARRQPEEPKVHGPPLRMLASGAGVGRRPTTILGHGESKDPRDGGSLRGALRILLNCLTLRNLRLCSFGISPRQSILFLLLTTFIVFGSVHWLLPLLSSSAA